MSRVILGILVGIVASICVLSLWEKYFHHTSETVPSNIESILNDDNLNAEFIKTQSLALTGYAVASVAGVVLSIIIGKSRKVLPSLVVTGVLILTSIAGFVLVPHPVWFVVISIFTIIIAASATIMLIFWIRQI